MATESSHEELPEATVVPARRARFSAIWVIPVLAALVALGVAWQRIANEGPTVTITFASAEGIEANKTFVKYKDVNIGQVTAVRLTDDLHVEVTAKIAKSAAPLMVEDARFWVVRPRISLSGISGLSTLLSGDYIGFETGASKNRVRAFTGLEIPPIITGGSPGREFVLRAPDLGSLGISSPVYFRRLPVGQVIAYELAPDGKSVVLRIFVNAPFDQYVTGATRFWNASGVDVSLSASGLDVRTQSLVSLLEGGVAFESPPQSVASAPAPAGAAYKLYGDFRSAMKGDEAIAVHYVLHFTESVRGVSVGAPVTFYGVTIGEVTDVGLTMNVGTLVVRPRVLITLYPERVVAQLPSAQVKNVMPFAKNEDVRHRFMRIMIEQRGLRAQLETGSLLTGQRVVSLGFFPNAPKAAIDWSAPVPELPTVASTLPEIESKLASVIAKLERVPLDAIGEDLKKALVTLDATLSDARNVLNHFDADVTPALKSTLEDARGALGSAERMLTSTEATLVGPSAPGQLELRNAMAELARAARSLRVLADYLERHPESLIRGKTAEPAPK
ncbi:MAG: MlaD family protein [Burkholderiales bacterium]